jgi:hypothetical protein
VIGSTRTLRVWAYAAPADLRKGFDGLQALVVSALLWLVKTSSGRVSLVGVVVASQWDPEERLHHEPDGDIDENERPQARRPSRWARGQPFQGDQCP